LLAQQPGAVGQTALRVAAMSLAPMSAHLV